MHTLLHKTVSEIEANSKHTYLGSIDVDTLCYCLMYIHEQCLLRPDMVYTSYIPLYEWKSPKNTLYNV